MTPDADLPASRGAGRLFLGVPLPDSLRGALRDHLDRWLGARPLPGRAVPPENWHLTLRFLGDTTLDARERVRRHLAATALGEPFRVGFGGCGAFPRARRAAILWLGIDRGTPRLRELAAAAETAAVRAGFEPDPRPFAAHLTLSRIRPPRDVRALLDAFPPFADSFEVREIALFRSHPGGGAPRYEVIDRFPLSERGGQE